MQDRYGYPTQGFFVAHRRFSGPVFPNGPVWGDILDGPVTAEDDVIEAIMESWKDDEFGPARADLRVWHYRPDGQFEDCTAWALTALRESIEDRTEART